MSDVSQLRTKYRQANNLDNIVAVLGDPDGLIPNNNIPGNVWITMLTSNGQSIGVSVRGPVGKLIKMTPGLSVQLEYDKKGRLRVAEPDTDSSLAAGVNPLGYAYEQNSDRYSQSGLETLAVVPDPNGPSLLVFVKAWNPRVNGTYYRFLGAIADLTDYVPAADYQCFAGIFVKNDFKSLEINASTPKPVAGLDLSETDVQECFDASSDGSTGVYAIKLVGLQTEITQSDIENDGEDLRQLVNTGDGSLGLGVLNVIACTATGSVLVTATGRVAWVGGVWTPA